MAKTRIRLTKFKSLSLDCTNELHDSFLPESASSTKLLWRQGFLFVKPSPLSLNLPALSSEEWILDCLKFSQVKGVCLDSQLDKLTIQTWASICQKARKPVFIHIGRNAPNSKIYPDWHLTKYLIDSSLSVLLLALLSPVILLLIGLIKVLSSTTVFTGQWCIGFNGKIFKAWRFYTVDMDKECKSVQPLNVNTVFLYLSRLMRQRYIDRLPQLINVVQGDISLASQFLAPIDLLIDSETENQFSNVLGVKGYLKVSASVSQK